MTRSDEPAVVAAERWLLLSFQLPAKPAYLRVKTWRRLQGLGAVAVKNAVYALPMTEQTQEDFEWLLKEITEGGGEGLICEARLVGGLSDEEVRRLFRAARDADYDEIAKEVRAIIKDLHQASTSEPRLDLAAQAKRARARRDGIVAIDFFGANGRETVDGLLSELDRLLMQDHGGRSAMEDPSQRPSGELRGRT